jgi:hypothetical protein
LPLAVQSLEVTVFCSGYNGQAGSNVLSGINAAAAKFSRLANQMAARLNVSITTDPSVSATVKSAGMIFF